MTSVEFGVRRGELPEEAITEFAQNWQLGAWQESSLRRAVHEDVARRGILVPELVCMLLSSESAECPNGTLIVVHPDVRCHQFLESKAKGLGIARHLADAMYTILNNSSPTTTLLIARSPRILKREYIAEYVRLKYAIQIDSLVLALPDMDGNDAGLIADASTLSKWWLSEAVAPPYYWTEKNFPFSIDLVMDQARRQGSLLRAWWLIAENITSALQSTETEEDEIKKRTQNGVLRCFSGKALPVKEYSFVVLIVEQGPADTSTAGTFADVAASLSSGLHSFGFASRVARCTDAPSCSGELRQPQEITVVLGAHNLQVFVDLNTNLPIVLGDHASFLLDPAKAILYNFEHVNSAFLVNSTSSQLKNLGGSFFSSLTLEIFRRAHTVWDYSYSNTQDLNHLGIQATHVPLGAAPPWHIHPFLHEYKKRSSSLFPDDDSALIDVLFYGTLTPHRAEILESLRAGPAPITVLHANAYSNGIFGTHLDAMILDAKIVLNLQAFDDDNEWKMPRLARLLANEKFVISQGSCTQPSDQCWSFRDGVIFTPLARLKETILFFLSRPKARRAVARRGHQAFQAVSYAENLHAPLCHLLNNTAWLDFE